MLDIAKYSHWSLRTPLYTHFTVSFHNEGNTDECSHRFADM